MHVFSPTVFDRAPCSPTLSLASKLFLIYCILDSQGPDSGTAGDEERRDADEGRCDADEERCDADEERRDADEERRDADEERME